MIERPHKIMPSGDIMKKNLLTKIQVVANDFIVRQKMPLDGTETILIDVRANRAINLRIGKELIVSLL